MKRDDQSYEEALVNTIRELKRRTTLAEIELELLRRRTTGRGALDPSVPSEEGKNRR